MCNYKTLKISTSIIKLYFSLDNAILLILIEILNKLEFLKLKLN